MKLDERTMRLIAVGASITANCQPCLRVSITEALECGIDKEEIAEAIEVARKVRHGAAAGMDTFISDLGHKAAASTDMTNGKCGCGS